MNTELEDALRGHMHRAVDSTNAPTEALIQAGQRRATQIRRRRRLLYSIPTLAAVAAVATVLLFAARPIPSTTISPTADQRPASDLASKLVALLPPTLQQTVIERSLGNKNVTNGRYGILTMLKDGGRVQLSVAVRKESAAHAAMPGEVLPDQVPGPKIHRTPPVSASAPSGSFTVTITEAWVEPPQHQKEAPVLPLSQAALHDMAQQAGWTVGSKLGSRP